MKRIDGVSFDEGPGRPSSSLEYAESLGLGFFCMCEIVCIAVWDDERRVWLDPDDEPYEPDVKGDQCPACGRMLEFPSEDQVKLVEV